MLTRRTFLGASSAAAITVGLADTSIARLLTAEQDSVAVFLSEHDESARLFVSGLGLSSTNCNCLADDFGFHTASLNLQEERSNLLIGFTRHSDFTLMKQLAEENGYYLAYSGDHRVGGGGLIHRMSGPANIVKNIRDDTADSPAHWPFAIARALTTEPWHDGKRISGEMTTLVVNGQHTQLTSWAFRKPSS